jgi:hypothetical protein
LFLYRVILTRDIKFDETRKYSDKNELIETPETKKIIQVIEIPSPDLYSKKDLILEDYKLFIDVLVDIIIIQDKIILRYCLIRPIDILIIQLLSPEVILELEQETTNNIFAFDLITLIYKSINSNKRAENILQYL